MFFVSLLDCCLNGKGLFSLIKSKIITLKEKLYILFIFSENLLYIVIIYELDGNLPWSE